MMVVRDGQTGTMRASPRDSARPRWAQIGALISMLLFSVSLWAPPAWTAESPKREVAFTSVEAWYHVLDDEVQPAPLPVVPDAMNPYGEDTLHVGITAGQEDARTYVGLDLSDLPATFDLRAATLILPVDPDAATMNPDEARVQVCLSALPPESKEGSFEEPPKVDCKTKSPATYVARPFPHLIADVTRFGEDLAFSGVAIMPTERAREQGDTWHVAFYGKKNEGKAAKPIKAQLLYLPSDLTPVISEEPTTEAIPQTDDFDGGISTGGGLDFSTSSGPAISQQPDEPIDRPPAPTPVEVAAPTQPTTATSQAAYTIVWALPLALLALSFYFGSALTREVVLRWDSRS